MLLYVATLLTLAAVIAATASNQPDYVPVRSSISSEIDFETFPECAYANCITSNQLSPSLLGCVSGSLTIDCLCETAVAPLSCSPTGPSDEDNCWYDLENWLADTCGGVVPLLNNSATMAPCMQSCVSNFIISNGCHTQTRNCMCVLPRTSTIDGVTACMQRDCSSRMAKFFSASKWRDDICSTGDTDDFDMAGYNASVKRVRDIRIGIIFLVCFLCTIVVISAVCIVPSRHRRDAILYRNHTAGATPANLRYGRLTICLFIVVAIIVVVGITPLYTIL